MPGSITIAVSKCQMRWPDRCPTTRSSNGIVGSVVNCIACSCTLRYKCGWKSKIEFQPQLPSHLTLSHPAITLAIKDCANESSELKTLTFRKEGLLLLIIITKLAALYEMRFKWKFIFIIPPPHPLLRRRTPFGHHIYTNVVIDFYRAHNYQKWPSTWKMS